MKLSLYEQETIILYDQAEAAAEVYTHDPRLLEKLRRLAARCSGTEIAPLYDREMAEAIQKHRADPVLRDGDKE